MTVSRWFLFEFAPPQDWPPHASAWCAVLLHVGCVECFEFTREPTDDAGHGYKLELPRFLLCSAPFFSEPVTSGPKISKFVYEH